MAEKLVGKRIKRNEDPRLLTGQALFVDDVELPGMLHAAFLRSDFAHAIINNIDTSEAKKRPGVWAVYTAEDMGDYWHPSDLLVPPPFAIEGAVFNEKTQVPMAKDKVRHSGEAIAVVIAESRYLAEDALPYIIADLEPLPAVVDLEKALESDSTLLYEDLGTNLAAHVKQEKGSYAEAKEKADLVISRKIFVDRCASGAMENRGLVVNWDEKTQHMDVWCTTQAPIPLRNNIAKSLGLAEHQVRAIAPFVGGGFGPKIMLQQPDEVVLTWASIQLKKPIKWIEDRREDFFASTSERDQVHYSELAINKNGKIVGLKDVFFHDTGAYDSYGQTLTLNTMTHTMGPYVVPNFYTECKTVFTTKMLTSPVRGAGRPQGVYVMERLLDVAAKELNIDPVEIRRRNLIQPDQFPYKTGIVGQDFVENILDSGDYPSLLEKAVNTIEYDKFVKE